MARSGLISAERGLITRSYSLKGLVRSIEMVDNVAELSFWRHWQGMTCDCNEFSDQLKLILTLSTHFCPSLVQVRLSRETNTKCVRLSLMASCTWLAASTVRTIMASTGKILCNKRGASKAAVFVASRTYLLNLTPAAVPPWWAPRRPCYAPEFNGREHVTHMIWILTRQIICRTCEKNPHIKTARTFTLRIKQYLLIQRAR